MTTITVILSQLLNKVNFRNHIKQCIVLFGNKDNIFQLQKELKNPWRIFNQVGGQ